MSIVIGEKSFALEEAEAKPQAIPVLGVPVGVVNLEGAVEIITRWIGEKRCRYVCASDVNSVVRALDDTNHMRALCSADLVVPDGAPVAWMMRVQSGIAQGRVCGPDLMLALCERAAKEGWRNYFYGGADGVAGALAEEFSRRFPSFRVVGTESPPFRPLSSVEMAATIDRINASCPDIVWVGLGCPKQESWMADHVGHIKGAILIGVGAAFDFHSGRVKRAPVWMRNNGLEWLHRLVSEPKRLWRRYLISAPRFFLACLAGKGSSNTSALGRAAK